MKFQHTPLQLTLSLSMSSAGLLPSSRVLAEVEGDFRWEKSRNILLWPCRWSIAAPKKPSATATTPPTAPPAIAPMLALCRPKLEPNPLVEFVLALEFPAVVVTLSVIMVLRSGSLQPLAGAPPAEPPLLLLGD